MTFRQSAACINAGLDAAVAALTGPLIMDIYTGPPPASCAASPTGTKLASLTGGAFSSASAGAKAMTGTWSGTASASGYAGYGRILDTTDTTVGFQFCIGENWLASKTYALGQQVYNGGNCYQCTTPGTSASSGGPSGTGTGIIDGTCVWAFVDAADFVIDNSNISNGQSVSVTGFTISGTANL